MDSKYISADSHVNEPPDLWTKNVPDQLRGLVPTMVELEAGDAWVVAPNAAPRPISFSAAAGAKAEEITSSRITYSSMRPGAFLADARLEDQDIDGLSGEVLYPAWGGACMPCTTKRCGPMRPGPTTTGCSSTSPSTRTD